MTWIFATVAFSAVVLFPIVTIFLWKRRRLGSLDSEPPPYTPPVFSFFPCFTCALRLRVVELFKCRLLHTYVIVSNVIPQPRLFSCNPIFYPQRLCTEKQSPGKIGPNGHSIPNLDFKHFKFKINLKFIFILVGKYSL